MVRNDERYRRIKRLCELLPKAELHAHLNGCARCRTIAELAPPTVDTSVVLLNGKDQDRSLDACFAVFGAIHKTVNALAVVRRITNEVLEDFAADNVKYLELRTTPRDLQDADAEAYVRCVLQILVEHTAASLESKWPLTVRLLLSVDRTGGVDKARTTVRLAARLRADEASGGAAHIVGVDFSGNPTKGSFAEYAEVFREARAAGLRVAVHTAEVRHDADAASILAFRPDRLGHALLLSERHLRALLSDPIPIELCPTSNLKTLRLHGFRRHPTMRRLLARGYPVSISTDDAGVFSTSPSEELYRAAVACDLTEKQVVALAAAAWDHAFEPDASGLRLRWRQQFEAAAEDARQQLS